MSKLEDLMSLLHTTLTEVLLERISSGEASTGDLNVARQLLRDNGIDVTLENREAPMLRLADELDTIEKKIASEA